MKIKSSLFFGILLLASPANLYAGQVLFDTSHTVIFHPQSDKPLGLNNFLTLFEKKGNKTKVSGAPLTDETLKNVSTIVLPGSMTPYNDFEVEKIKNFVKNGGNLLVLLHIAPPLSKVTRSFGIVLSNMVMAEKENIIGGSSQDFFAKDISPHPVTEGVKEVALFGTWGLLAENGAKSVVSTSESAWGDYNRNRQYDAGEPVTRAGVVAVAEHGSGRVVVVADDAPLANAFINLGSNLRLAENIVNWLTRR